MEDCIDILNAVVLNVEKPYINRFYLNNVKTRVITSDENVNENLKMTSFSDPASETNVNSKDTVGETTETVTESIVNSADNKIIVEMRKDVEDKFPYAMASVCCELSELDKLYRKINGKSEQPGFCATWIDCTEEFPLSERFAAACIMYISSMMLLDIDEKISDRYYDKYILSVSRIESEIPFGVGLTAEKYPY